MRPFGVRSGSVRAPFGIRSDQFRTKIFGAKKNREFKNFQFVRPSPRRGPSSCRPEPHRPKGPRRGGDGRTNSTFLQKDFQNPSACNSVRYALRTVLYRFRIVSHRFRTVFRRFGLFRIVFGPFRAPNVAKSLRKLTKTCEIFAKISPKSIPSPARRLPGSLLGAVFEGFPKAVVTF